ncbi:homeobox transcription factor [Aspergillus campestris IBT 28561]|uniref:Homeobox transcription factor n=1 Tax=Aspergillus campestris (strain IBT 28561) TaxID=1392248 RepID=A0A2I1CYJ0_ASPC2|nr:homeobox transcription factor [Aspergillus campestris IBT 28561]PKY02697.1 homeobox transcription factor [Aspergillus campestris IBT 28561]
MSQYRDLGEGNGKMAISYASGIPADHSQALPSFRELLPPHLHDEIESTSYFTSRQPPRERPASASHDVSGPHPMTDPRPYGPTSKMAMGEVQAPRDYSVAPPNRSHGAVQSRVHGNAPAPAPAPPATSTPRFASRGPSPILPPIRDLQSISDRGAITPTAPFPDVRPVSRPDSYSAQDYRAGPAPIHGYAGSMGDRRSTDAYMANGGPPVMHGQVAYPYPPMSYQSDSEQSAQALSHAHHSNFGILGDPIDSKNKRRRGNLPKPVTDILRAWFHEHLDHPYPSEEDKQMFMTRTGLTISQISNWFINARRRQLPALRNQMRNGASDFDSQRQSPFSDVDHNSPESMPSPHRMGPKP